MQGRIRVAESIFVWMLATNFGDWIPAFAQNDEENTGMTIYFKFGVVDALGIKDHVTGFFSNHDGRGIGVTRDNGWHN